MARTLWSEVPSVVPADALAEIRIVRLQTADIPLARATFAVMAEVFEEAPPLTLSDGYLARLLARPDFWALAALSGLDPVGGLTAHVLPMTRGETSELFIYDVAVRAHHQRRGIGRALMTALREDAARAGIASVFVPADNEDAHALDFYRALGGAAAAVTIFTFDD
jgi:aminoglycoside 3-N-acetyltransferase I